MQANSDFSDKNIEILPSRILHTMIRVSNLERSLAFYQDALGMVEIRREDYPEGQFTLSFLGYSEDPQGPTIELTYNYDKAEYTHGSGFGHIAVAVSDINAAYERLSGMDIKIIRRPGPMAYTTTNGQRDVIAFISDSDGYQIELISSSKA
ncbi:lactoylglutathione lyase [Kiloniella sp. EL199]|uniref:lactoylglutathione lyase n=1 Tax=Kiloniella sp. EL199 TaxID=2107581 RepID=UPI000EA0D959|nr:lactoylglutathione lyase [Kiloniella sp. EL199]